ncbi:hypothetical protein C3747_103g138 [Trypanosoma cruzi]|uniref:Uncharacterized protein n=2 Tax=Trypanosoma cruzi TaxID=5693 RepID=Q4CXF8_TRYCC|nr:hypothetical protein, conserved [Trypanosoma cruzi]EAN84957.1 hypothetical protein, conserved [Trypanosoma cruzi]PWV07290.1 hypothetical protein C3747_103g138 [Trypanosoma cruzi]RNC46706.1 hypothetical protein TcCL_NonESM03447 [Trypanosoma cruzi]|eukprot:XP_806808.1 hypothetical protein [Trypanosoma cruzi strain CL Brener]
MNSLGDRFRCVVALLSGDAGNDDNTAAYHVAIVMPAMGAAALEEEVAANTVAFGAANKMKIVDWGSDTAALLAAAHGPALAHVSLLRADAVAFADARQQLLAHHDPTLLLLELACEKAMPFAAEYTAGDEWSWIRPPSSYFAELTESERDAAVCIPAVMRCSCPLARATASLLSPSLWMNSAVTLNGMLREVGYKVGCLSKYGS